MQRFLRQEVGPRQKRRRYSGAARQLLLDCSILNHAVVKKLCVIRFNHANYFRRIFLLPQSTTTARPVVGKWNSPFEYASWFVYVLI
jgi:hypothetical protein